jgi:antitoxin component of MazEF toxin-antitoxin module
MSVQVLAPKSEFRASEAHPAGCTKHNVDNADACNYNVITMKASIITIGNSKGVRIPKPLLEESGLGKDVEIKATTGEIRIVAAKPNTKVSETALLSERVLARDWLLPEEDEAWSSLK